jgi:hypothetical protein
MGEQALDNILSKEKPVLIIKLPFVIAERFLVSRRQKASRLISTAPTV